MRKIKCFCINSNDLYMEHLLVYMDYPILYTCTDNSDNRYLAMCVDPYEGYYILAKIDTSVLVEMLCGTLPMKDAFSKCKELYRVYYEEPVCDNKVQKVNFCDIEDDDLPESDAMFVVTNSETKEFIAKLKTEYETAYTPIQYHLSWDFIADKFNNLDVSSISLTCAEFRTAHHAYVFFKSGNRRSERSVLDIFDCDEYTEMEEVCYVT